MNAHIDKKEGSPETVARDFVLACATLFRTLAIHSPTNSALKRPTESFLRSLSSLKSEYKVNGIELVATQQGIWIEGRRVQNHFSIVEAINDVVRILSKSLIRSVRFEPQVKPEAILQLFADLSAHARQNREPNSFDKKYAEINLGFFTPETTDFKVQKSNSLSQSDHALEIYFVFKRNVEDFFRGMSNNMLIPQEKLRSSMTALVEIAQVAPHHLVSLSLIRDDRADQNGVFAVASQAIATSLLSIVLAREMYFSFSEQVSMGLVGLMYNVGLLGKESAIIMKNEKLSPSEYRRVMDAQALGVYKLLRGQSVTRPALERLLAIFEYARGKTEQSVSLSVETRVLKICSQYVALTSQRPFRDAYTLSEAVKLLVSKISIANKADLDPLLYFVFVRSLGVIPLGSLCLLNDGRQAIVYRPSGKKPGMPVVKLRVSQEGESPVVLDLADHPGLQISKTLDPRREGVNVTGYLFD